MKQRIHKDAKIHQIFIGTYSDGYMAVRTGVFKPMTYISQVRIKANKAQACLQRERQRVNRARDITGPGTRK